MTRHLLGVAAVAFVALGSLSCGSSSQAGRSAIDGPASKLEIPQDWLVSGTSGEVPPLTAVLVQLGADSASLENGATVLAAECMAKVGFTYEPTLAPVHRDADPFGAGNLDPARTATEGYGDIVGGDQLDPQAAPVQRYEDSLSPAEGRRFASAFMGTRRQDVKVDGGGYSVPKDGCLAEARRAIAGDAFMQWTSAQAAIEDAVALATVEFEDSPEWVGAEKRWSACMSKKGYHYAGNSDAIGAAGAKFGDETATGKARTVSRAEIDMATADAICRRTARFTETTIEVQGPLERRAMTAVEGPILAWMDTRDAVLKKAEDALRSGAGG